MFLRRIQRFFNRKSKSPKDKDNIENIDNHKAINKEKEVAEIHKKTTSAKNKVKPNRSESKRSLLSCFSCRSKQSSNSHVQSDIINRKDNVTSDEIIKNTELKARVNDFVVPMSNLNAEKEHCLERYNEKRDSKCSLERLRDKLVTELKEMEQKSKQFDIGPKIEMWEAKKMVILPKPWYMTISKNETETSPVWHDIRTELHKDETILNNSIEATELAEKIISELLDGVVGTAENKNNTPKIESIVAEIKNNTEKIESIVRADTMSDESISTDTTVIYNINADDLQDNVFEEDSLNECSNDTQNSLSICELDSNQNDSIEIKKEVEELLANIVELVAVDLSNQASEASCKSSRSDSSNGSETSEAAPFLTPEMLKNKEFLEFLFTHPFRIQPTMTRSLNFLKYEKKGQRYNRKSSLTEYDELLRYLIPFQKFTSNSSIRKNPSESSLYQKLKQIQRLSLPNIEKMEDPTWKLCIAIVFPTSLSVESIITLP